MWVVVISGVVLSDAVDSPLHEECRHVNLFVQFLFLLRPVIVDSLFTTFFIIDPVGLSVIIPDISYVHCISSSGSAFPCPVARFATFVTVVVGVISPRLVVLSGPVASGLTLSFTFSLSFSLALAFAFGQLSPASFAFAFAFATLPVGVALAFLPVSFSLPSLASLASLPVPLASLPSFALALLPSSFLPLSFLPVLALSFASVPVQGIHPISRFAVSLSLCWGIVVVDQFTDVIKVSDVWTQLQV